MFQHYESKTGEVFLGHFDYGDEFLLGRNPEATNIESFLNITEEMLEQRLKSLNIQPHFRKLASLTNPNRELQ